MGKVIVRTVTVLAFVGLFVLNIATVTVPAVATGVVSIVSAVVGASAILPEFRTVIYRGQKRRLVEAVVDTTERVSIRTAKGASRNVGSVAGEAIPLAGIAVVVGVTALELKDACDTMNDLRALELSTDPTLSEDNSVAEVCGLEVPSNEQAWEAMKASPSHAWEEAKGYIPELPEMPLPTWRDIIGGPTNEIDIQTPWSKTNGNWSDRLNQLNPFD